MALEHEFYILTPEITKSLDDSQIDEFNWANRKNALCVHDDFILPHYETFVKIDSVFSYPNGPIFTKGLNYYGYTVFLPDSLPQLCDALRSISMGSEFDQLIEMCKKAYKSHLAVLHAGV